MLRFFWIAMVASVSNGWSAQSTMWPYNAESLCESQWPDDAIPNREDSQLCSRYWLKRYVFGDSSYQSIGSSTDIDPHFFKVDHNRGRYIETRLSAAQFDRMSTHVQAAFAPVDADGSPQSTTGEDKRIRDRVVGFFHDAVEGHFTLRGLSSHRIPSIVESLGKVVRGLSLDPRRDLHCRSDVTLWKLENAVYARHGADFDHVDLTTFFYGARIQALARPIRSRILPLKSNPDYSDDLLTEIDNANLDLIRYVASLGGERCKPVSTWEM